MEPDPSIWELPFAIRDLPNWFSKALAPALD